MDRRRTSRAVGLFVPALLLVGLLLWPTPLGGATSYVIVTGNSMEPTYRDGDLVIARSAGSYDVGDIVTFDAPDGVPDSIYHVIHRVVAITGDGAYITQGDNRDVVDEWTPTDDDVLGHSVVRLPGLGLLVRYLQANPPAMLALTTGTFVLATSGATSLRRRRVRRGAPPARRRLMTSKTPVTLPVRTAGPRWAPLALAAAVTVLVSAGWTTWQAMTAPPTVAASDTTTPYATSFAYSYTAQATPSLVYPDGQVGPVAAPDDAQPVALDQADAVPGDSMGDDAFTDGAPDNPTAEAGTETPQTLYTDLIDVLDLTVEAGIDAERGDVRVTGGHRAETTITAADGWERTTPFESEVSLVDGTATLHGRLDVEEILAVLTRLEGLTGSNPFPATVSVTSTVELAGTVDGHEVRDQVVSTFDIGLDGQELTPSTALLREDRNTVGVDTQVASTMAGLPLPAARALGAGTFATSLLAVAWLLPTMLLGWRRPEHEGIRARHGALIVTVDTDPVRGAQPMPVGAIADLVRLAKREQTCILHHHTDDGVHRYVVPDGLMAFIYEATDPADEPRTDDDLDLRDDKTPRMMSARRSP